MNLFSGISTLCSRLIKQKNLCGGVGTDISYILKVPRWFEYSAKVENYSSKCWEPRVKLYRAHSWPDFFPESHLPNDHHSLIQCCSWFSHCTMLSSHSEPLLVTPFGIICLPFFSQIPFVPLDSAQTSPNFPEHLLTVCERPSSSGPLNIPLLPPPSHWANDFSCLFPFCFSHQTECLLSQ